MKTDKLRRLTAASLVLAFTLPQAAQAAAPTVETDESVYISTWIITVRRPIRAS